MSGARILIVDDDTDFSESLGEALELHGHDVALEHCGETAITLFAGEQFDIVFMDVKLPGMNGVESFFELRKLHSNSKVMMMTGYSVQELLDEAIEQGALGVLEKPLDMERVLDAVEQAKPDGIVLLADDNPDFVDSVAATLENAGYAVLVANDGGEAVKMIVNHRVDVLLLDLHMPVLNGLEVYLELKSRNQTVPTLIVTGYAEEEAEQLKALTAMTHSGCLMKPFDPAALLDAVGQLLRAEVR